MMRDHQQTCPACGKPLGDGPLNLEVLIDPSIRYVFVHWDESTYVRQGTNGK